MITRTRVIETVASLDSDDDSDNQMFVNNASPDFNVRKDLDEALKKPHLENVPEKYPYEEEKED